jgi:hypothetical protein
MNPDGIGYSLLGFGSLETLPSNQNSWAYSWLRLSRGRIGLVQWRYRANLLHIKVMTLF